MNINPRDTVRLMKKIYCIDMEKIQYSKLLFEIPPVDIVITMGCNVSCPLLACGHREHWGLNNPTGRSDNEFRDVINEIQCKLQTLAENMNA